MEVHRISPFQRSHLFTPRDWVIYLFGWYLLVDLGCQSWTSSSRSFLTKLSTHKVDRSVTWRADGDGFKMFQKMSGSCIVERVVWEWFLWFWYILMWVLYNACCVLLSTTIAFAYKCGCNKIQQSGMFQPDAMADVPGLSVTDALQPVPPQDYTNHLSILFARRGGVRRPCWVFVKALAKLAKLHHVSS